MHKKKKPAFGRNPIVANYQGLVIRYSDLVGLFTEDYWEGYYYWVRFKSFGLPNGNSLGWVNEPAEVMDSIAFFEDAHNEWEANESEKRSRDMEAKQNAPKGKK